MAVRHAISLASAGLRFDPLRKNSRVNDTNTKVRRIFQTWVMVGRLVLNMSFEKLRKRMTIMMMVMAKANILSTGEGHSVRAPIIIA